MAGTGAERSSSPKRPERDALHREIERALASVPGVAWARVRSEDGAPPRLRLGLRSGQERAPVAAAVAATLDERFAITIDPAAVRVVAPVSDETASAPIRPTSTGPLVGRRASITHLDITHLDACVRVTIGLARDERRAEGTAVARSPQVPVPLAIGQATAAALTRLTVSEVELEILEVTQEPASDPTRVLVIVRFGVGQLDEQLIGASLVRGDPEHAVVRATLDAVNRRVEPLLGDELPPGTRWGVASERSSPG